MVEIEIGVLRGQFGIVALASVMYWSPRSRHGIGSATHPTHVSYGGSPPRRRAPSSRAPIKQAIGVSDFAEEYVANGHIRILVLRQTAES
jgi:hypothetical protein